MHNLVVPASPPLMDSFAPEFCFCGKKTVESHEFWFCSTDCARMDSLRSLDDPECHYRNAVRNAYVRAGVPGLYPRRTMSIDQLRSGLSEPRGFVDAPSRVPPPTKPLHQKNVPPTRRGAHDLNTAGFPTLSQVTDKVLIKKAAAGEPLVAERHDRPRFQGFPNAPAHAKPVQNTEDHIFEQISLDVIPLPERTPARSLRHVPQSSDGLKNNIRKSVAALLSVGRSRKDGAGEHPERIFGHPVKSFIPIAITESPPSHRWMTPPSSTSVQGSNALRRSASFAGRGAAPQGGPSSGHAMVMHVVEEMREECCESFDPKSLFDLEEAY